MATRALLLLMSFGALVSGAIWSDPRYFSLLGSLDRQCLEPDRIVDRVGSCFVALKGGQWLVDTLGIASNWQNIVVSQFRPTDKSREEMTSVIQNLQELLVKAKASREVRANLCRASHDLLYCARADVLGSCFSSYDEILQQTLRDPERQLERFGRYHRCPFPGHNLVRQALRTSIKESFDTLQMMLCAVCGDEARLIQVIGIADERGRSIATRFERMNFRSFGVPLYELLGRCGNQFGRVMATFQATGEIGDPCEVEPAATCVGGFVDAKLLLDESDLFERLVKVFFAQTFCVEGVMSEKACASRELRARLKHQLH